MPLLYKEKWSLTHEHTDAINCVAFSPDGSFLASGSTDNRIVVWSLASGQALHRIVARSAVLSLIWPGAPSRIVCGTADGTLITIDLVMDKSAINVSGFDAHMKPIECLCINSSSAAPYHLASAAMDIVKLWSWDSQVLGWKDGYVLNPPKSNPYSDAQPPIVTSVRWLSDPNAHCLISSYLYHGVFCTQWHSGAMQTIWSIRLPSWLARLIFTDANLLYEDLTIISGYCSLAPDNKTIAICSINRGFEVYEIPSGLVRPTLKVPTDKLTMVLPIIYVHGGSMLLGGSTIGKARLWDFDSTFHIQALRNQDLTIIQCLDAYCEEPLDKFQVATGSSDPGRPNLVRVWEAVEVSEAKQDHEPQEV